MSPEEQEARKRREKEEKERREAEEKAKVAEERRRAKRAQRREKKEMKERMKSERKAKQVRVPVTNNRKIIFLSCATRSGEATCRNRVVRGVNVLELKAGPMLPAVSSTAALWGTEPAPFVNECNYGIVRIRYRDQSNDLVGEEEGAEDGEGEVEGEEEEAKGVEELEGKVELEGAVVETKDAEGEGSEDSEDDDDDEEDDDEEVYDQETYSAPEPEVFATNVVAQKSLPVVLLGPVIGKVTDTSAIVMIEVDCDARISCTLTDIFSGQQHSASVQARKGRPSAFQFTTLDPGKRYRISLGRVRFRALGVDSCYGTLTTPDFRPETGKKQAEGEDARGDKRGRPRFRAFAVSGDDLLSLRFGEKNLWKALHEQTSSAWASADIIIHAGGQVNLSPVLAKGRELLEV